MQAMVVDDDSVSRMAMAYVLEHLGITSLNVFKDGMAAWEYLQKGPMPVLVCCDIRMPELTGIELLERVRDDERLAEIPFILITGQRDRDTIEIAIACKVSGFIIKPFEPERAMPTIKDILVKHLPKIAEKPAPVCRRLGIKKDRLMSYYEMFKQRQLKDLSDGFAMGRTVDRMKQYIAEARKGCETLGIWHGVRLMDDLSEFGQTAEDGKAYTEAVASLIGHLGRSKQSRFFM